VDVRAKGEGEGEVSAEMCERACRSNRPLQKDVVAKREEVEMDGLK
jgi:hypothetical protein